MYQPCDDRTTDVKQRVNIRFDKLLRKDIDGKFKPYVCAVCDKLLKPLDVCALPINCLEENKDLLKPTDWNFVPEGLANCYKYNGGTGCADVNMNEVNWIEDLMLSPRASYINPDDRRCTDGLSVCAVCKVSLQQGKMPKYAIANNYCFGTPPKCLLDLTDVELAMLTPVKTYGYCFSYTGGMQKQLKGSLSYYKVNIESIVRSAAHFDILGLADNVVVLLYGAMTPEQRRKAAKKNRIRTSKVLAALQWLLLNNEEWRYRNINLDEVRTNLRNPVMIDNSTTENTELSSNVESTESFQVFFPDGTMSPLTGGQGCLKDFQEMVNAAKSNGYNIEFRCHLLKEAVSDFKDNNLVNACLLQFPYGRGGMHELRAKPDGSLTSQTDISEYVEHLSLVSQPHFHHELFSLILYNLNMKQNMVRTAGWRVRNKADARSLAEEITEEDIARAVSSRQNHNPNGFHSRGNLFLKAVDAITGSAPHTNQAAKRAKRDGEALQHHFGLPSFFLTVTPDDDNSIVVQAYSGEEIDNDVAVSSLSDDELTSRAQQRTAIRLKFPGICAFFMKQCMKSLSKK